MLIDFPLAFCVCEQYWYVASGIRAMRMEETYPTAVIVVQYLYVHVGVLEAVRQFFHS